MQCRAAPVVTGEAIFPQGQPYGALRDLDACHTGAGSTMRAPFWPGTRTGSKGSLNACPIRFPSPTAPSFHLGAHSIASSSSARNATAASYRFSKMAFNWRKCPALRQRQVFVPPAARAPASCFPKSAISGDTDHAPRRFSDWLRAEVRRDIAASVAKHAKALGCTPKRIAVRDQATRWGSCSTSGTLSFSWRLIFAPPFVLDYVAAHEVAHMREMNHGPRFWRLVKDAVPATQKARIWLKRHGAELHRFGSDY